MFGKLFNKKTINPDVNDVGEAQVECEPTKYSVEYEGWVTSKSSLPNHVETQYYVDDTNVDVIFRDVKRNIGEYVKIKIEVMDK